MDYVLFKIWICYPQRTVTQMNFSKSWFDNSVDLKVYFSGSFSRIKPWTGFGQLNWTATNYNPLLVSLKRMDFNIADCWQKTIKSIRVNSQNGFSREKEEIRMQSIRQKAIKARHEIKKEVWKMKSLAVKLWDPPQLPKTQVCLHSKTGLDWSLVERWPVKRECTVVTHRLTWMNKS